MQFNKLTVELSGPIWKIHDFDIENIDVLDKVDFHDNLAAVTVENFEVTDDNLLNVFIGIGAPNNTVYMVSIDGELKNADVSGEFHFEKQFTVTTSGRLRILIEKSIS